MCYTHKNSDNWILCKSHHRINKSSVHTCIHCITEYIFNRTKLPLFSGMSENWMPCLLFCTVGDWRKFPQVSLWIHTCKPYFSTHTLSVPSIIRHFHTVIRPVALPLCITTLDSSAEWIVEVFLEAIPLPQWFSNDLSVHRTDCKPHKYVTEHKLSISATELPFAGSQTWEKV